MLCWFLLYTLPLAAQDRPCIAGLLVVEAKAEEGGVTGLFNFCGQKKMFCFQSHVL